MILTIIFSFIIGIFIGSLFPVTFWLLTALVVLAVCCFIYRYIASDSVRKTVTLVAVILLSLACGMTRIYVSNLYRRSTLDTYAGHKIFAEGIVVSEPDVRETKTFLTISLRKLKLSSTSPDTLVHENIIVSVPLYPEFSYGDEVGVSTVLTPPSDITSPDGRVFDYAGYLRVRNIWYVGAFPYVTYVSSGHGSTLQSWLFSLKHTFTRALSNALPPPESSLMAGLLIGAKQALGKELLTEFSRAGVSHVVVLSGYNIVIVAESIMAMLAFLPALTAFIIGCVSILLFTTLSGGGASAVRAAIMVLVALWAKKVNREYNADRAFGFAVVAMLVWNPMLLVFDPSFQLSILATIGIIFVSPYVEPYLVRVTEKYGLREVVSATISTQIIVLPFLIYNTGILSLTALPVNILILGTVPLTMLLGFVTGAVGLFSLYLSFIPALPSYALLWYQLTVVHIGATFPFGVWNLPAFSIWVLFIIYPIIFVGLYFLKRKRS